MQINKLLIKGLYSRGKEDALIRILKKSVIKKKIMGNEKKGVKHVGMKVKTFQQQDISKTVKKRTVNYRVERGRREV